MRKIPESSNHLKKYYQKMILKRGNEILQGLRKELHKGISKGVELRSSQGSDLGDLSTLNLNNALSISFTDRYSNILKGIDNALERVEEGTYGYCEECDEKIDRRRLEIIPFALYCVKCQRKIEEERKRGLRR